jgi:hypothetical protein
MANAHEAMSAPTKNEMAMTTDMVVSRSVKWPPSEKPSTTGLVQRVGVSVGSEVGLRVRKTDGVAVIGLMLLVGLTLELGDRVPRVGTPVGTNV